MIICGKNDISELVRPEKYRNADLGRANHPANLSFPSEISVSVSIINKNKAQIDTISFVFIWV